MIHLRLVLISACCLAGGFACQQPDTNASAGQVAAASVSEQEPAEDAWTALFDGTSLEHWRDYRKDGISWQIEDGTLTTPGGQGDIVSKQTYHNFELEFEWKISEAGNSGVMYLVQEGDHAETYHTGPEYQLIDAESFTKKHNDQLEDNQKTAANYGLDTPTGVTAKPAGQWNQSRIVVHDGHVEHWLNGQKAVSYELWTDDWKNKVNQTKFKEWPAYGMAKEGHIALQDHGDQVWFKNIRIKEL